ncbi:PA14 domain-containing protein [Sneathiella sp.]|uniref:PA14 domain-containing protein n=1 Tax=Sneathiella sp. TaxID=1964365 RepID=UPI003565BE0C
MISGTKLFAKRHSAAILLAAGVFFSALTGHAAPFTDLTPASPQPEAGELEPGLAVKYYGAEINKMSEFDEWMNYKKGFDGKPIPMLNYQVGAGNVLTSDSSDFVAADIHGFINLEKPGRYTFMVQSNDGVWLSIGDKLIFEDPTVHGDSFSDELVLEITEPGWYPIHIKYFEKRNSSTLELYWEAPGGGDMDYVPADVFKHMRK